MYHVTMWSGGYKYYLQDRHTFAPFVVGTPGVWTLEEAMEQRRKHPHTTVFHENGTFKSAWNPIVTKRS